MKPLTDDTLAKAAIIEGYAWEAAGLEVQNKNQDGAMYFMRVATSVHGFADEADERAEIPPPDDPAQQDGMSSGDYASIFHSIARALCEHARYRETAPEGLR